VLTGCRVGLALEWRVALLALVRRLVPGRRHRRREHCQLWLPGVGLPQPAQEIAPAGRCERLRQLDRYQA